MIRHVCLVLAATCLLLSACPATRVVASEIKIVPAGGLRVTVGPGECTVDGKKVSVGATKLQLDPVTIKHVSGEKTVLTSDAPRRWAKGTSLKQCVGRGTTLPGCLVPGSVVVRPVDGGPPLVKDKDYLLDEHWAKLGRIEGGRIAPDEAVSVDYDYSLARLDTIQVSPEGVVSLRKGVEAKTCPHPPGAAPGCLALANVFLNYHTREITAADIYPIGPPLPAPSKAAFAKRASCVAKARRKLSAGEPLRVGFWGDSVTCGGDASQPERRFADAFIGALRKKYPKAAIEFFNAGIGGSSTGGRLANLDKDVLEKKPDLVVIEFVNDMGFSPETMRKHYYEAIDKIRAAGAEVILVAPHFTMPSMMGFAERDYRGVDQRRACQALREIAEEKHVGLADAARRWQHLAAEGLPYITLLFNGINHPDDRGHQIFVDELMTFFEDAETRLENIIVFKKEGVYACFPSLFQYADGTLVTGFGTRVRRSHIDNTGGSKRMVSRDGGITWQDAGADVPYYNPATVRADGNLAIAGAVGWHYVDESEAQRLKDEGRTTLAGRPGTVAYLSGAHSMVRAIDGKVIRPWTDIEVPPSGGMMNFNQSSYLNLGDGVRLVAIYSTGPKKDYSAYVLRTEDDGDTWTCLPMALDNERINFNETALGANAEGHVIALLRTAESADKSARGYLYQVTSTDRGKTWSEPVDTGIWGYPANVLRLPDGRLVATYGYRRAPMGIRACLSRDGGKTWDVAHEIVLRSDGASGGDLGYPITQRLPDGTLATIYYFNTADNIAHISLTRWTPPVE